MVPCAENLSKACSRDEYMLKWIFIRPIFVKCIYMCDAMMMMICFVNRKLMVTYKSLIKGLVDKVSRVF